MRPSQSITSSRGRPTRCALVPPRFSLLQWGGEVGRGGVCRRMWDGAASSSLKYERGGAHLLPWLHEENPIELGVGETPLHVLAEHRPIRVVLA